MIIKFLFYVFLILFLYYFLPPFIFGRSRAKQKIKGFIYGYLYVIRFFYLYNLLFVEYWKITLAVALVILFIFIFFDVKKSKLKLFLGLFFFVFIPVYLYFAFLYYMFYVIWDFPVCYTFLNKDRRILLRNWYNEVLQYFRNKRKKR